MGNLIIKTTNNQQDEEEELLENPKEDFITWFIHKYIGGSKTIPVKFQDNDYTQNTIRIFHSPLINLTKDNDFNDIRFSIATMGAMDCSPKDMEKFYKAYRKFASLMHDDSYAVKYKLKAVEIFSFNNRRILHGRTEYDPNSGNRHLQGYYMDRDEILGRLNFLKK